jgi:hypothetical protein
VKYIEGLGPAYTKAKEVITVTYKDLEADEPSATRAFSAEMIAEDSDTKFFNADSLSRVMMGDTTTVKYEVFYKN